MLAELCRRAIQAWPASRILMVVHVLELIEQNLAKLLPVWPGAPVGVYSASAGSRQLGRAITYVSRPA
jgi:DNA repair protein RadD